MARAKVEGREGWAREIEAWRASGQTLSAWARSRGISRDRMEYWKRQLAGRQGKADGMGPLALIPVLPSPPEARADVPIEVIIERAGLRVRLPADFDAGTLSRLLDVVAARC